jgi:hypothetical protein
MVNNMGMEGINWEALNHNTNELARSFGSFSKMFTDSVTKFEDELCQVWASGNAVTFGEKLIYSVTNITKIAKDSCESIIDKIKTAANTYAETFNVPNELTIGQSYSDFMNSEVTERENKFKETVKGITGMNKEAARESLDTFVYHCDYCYRYIEDTVKDIWLPIYDNAEAQQNAFKETLEKMKKDIYENFYSLAIGVKYYINEEIDRVELAKAQTTSTFNS